MRQILSTEEVNYPHLEPTQELIGPLAEELGSEDFVLWVPGRSVHVDGGLSILQFTMGCRQRHYQPAAWSQKLDTKFLRFCKRNSVKGMLDRLVGDLFHAGDDLGIGKVPVDNVVRSNLLEERFVLQ